MQTLFQRPDRISDKLNVITPLFNALRFRSRWKLYEDFAKRCHEAGAVLWTIECAFGDRDWAVTDANNPFHFRVRTKHELWLKENLINVAASRLPHDARYIAWIDADVNLVRDDWANEAVHELQHYDFIQLWTQFQDVGPNYELIGTIPSFLDCYERKETLVKQARGNYHYPKGLPGKLRPGAPGLAWACTREAFNHVGGLIDWPILGAGDSYMAYGLIGELQNVLQPGLHPRYKESMLEWQARATRSIKKNVGCMKGLALHYWHGKKILRRYGTREEILIRNQFNPDVDLKKDIYGVYQLTGRSTQLRDDIRAYFRARDEDSTATCSCE